MNRILLAGAAFAALTYGVLRRRPVGAYRRSRRLERLLRRHPGRLCRGRPDGREQSEGSDYASDIEGGFGGLYWGKNWQSGNWVYGLDGSISFASIEDQNDAVTNADDVDVTIEGFSASRLRLGYAFDNFMIFAAGGLSLAKANVDDGEFDDDTWLKGYVGIQGGFASGDLTVDNLSVGTSYESDIDGWFVAATADATGSPAAGWSVSTAAFPSRTSKVQYGLRTDLETRPLEGFSASRLRLGYAFDNFIDLRAPAASPSRVSAEIVGTASPATTAGSRALPSAPVSKPSSPRTGLLASNICYIHYGEEASDELRSARRHVRLQRRRRSRRPRRRCLPLLIRSPERSSSSVLATGRGFSFCRVCCAVGTSGSLKNVWF